MSNFDRARNLITRFKGDKYVSGFDVLPRVGKSAAELGKSAALVRDTFPGSAAYGDTIQQSLKAAGVEVRRVIDGARPNAPREDVFRITDQVRESGADMVVSFGGGSTIDAAKAAIVLSVLGGSIDDYFGTGTVTAALERTGKKLLPHLAIQTASSSAAQLTKYSNITDLATGQKKLIVDTAIVPARAAFDFEVTFGTPASLTADGAVDGLAHILEVLYSETGKANYGLMVEMAEVGIPMILEHLPRVLQNPKDRLGREALALATDLGGYAIMVGGTNGAHLTSFSLIDILSHGRACCLMNPYYTVFFAPAVQGPLQLMAKMCHEAGYASTAINTINGRDLGVAVAQALIAFEKRVGIPTTLGEVPGFSQAHIERALAAAKNPQLKMKLENMPVPLTAEMVDQYMGPVLEAGKTGRLDIIKNVPIGASA